LARTTSNFDLGREIGGKWEGEAVLSVIGIVGRKNILGVWKLGGGQERGYGVL